MDYIVNIVLQYKKVIKNHGQTTITQ